MESFRKLNRVGIRGLVFDIDDTVTRKGVLQPDAYAAMHRLSEAGFELVAVTGRPLGWTDVLARLWPVRIAVGENGAGWAWVDHTGTHEGYFCTDTQRGEQAILLETIRREVASAMPHVKTTNDHRHRRCDLAFDVGESASLPRSDVDALIRLIETLGARSSVSTVHAHAVPGPWDKAAGVEQALREVLGIDLRDEIERWVFIGDSGNDAAAFERFPKSVGVANVREHLDRLHVPPRFITDSERGAGFAELAAHLMGDRG